MIGYVLMGTNDLARAASFYDALVGEMGGRRKLELERSILWGRDKGAPIFGVITPFDGKPATPGNGFTLALRVDSHAAVDMLHAKALALGATDDGAPGARGTGKFYGAYFRDLDGNKVVFYHA
jgi:catechol 2,3-dioxygenase-like lactoylglutathione lyase family enzyme